MTNTLTNPATQTDNRPDEVAEWANLTIQASQDSLDEYKQYIEDYSETNNKRFNKLEACFHKAKQSNDTSFLIQISLFISLFRDSLLGYATSGNELDARLATF